jgi:hypothetical protein
LQGVTYFQQISHFLLEQFVQGEYVFKMTSCRNLKLKTLLLISQC